MRNHSVWYYLGVIVGVIFAGIGIAFLLALVMLIVTGTTAWVFDIEFQIYALGVTLLILMLLVVTFFIIKGITTTSIWLMVWTTITFYIYHPLIARPYRAIKYLVIKKEKKIDYITKISEDSKMISNLELNNTKHRLNTLNFLKLSFNTNNELLYIINLKQFIIKQSFPNAPIILESRYKVKLDELSNIEDSFITRREYLAEQQTNYKYRKETKHKWAVVLMLLAIIALLGLFIASVVLMPTLSILLLFGFIIGLVAFSVMEYKSIIESKIVVSQKEMDKMKESILYDVRNLERLQDKVGGFISNEYEVVMNIINSTSVQDGIKSDFNKYIEAFGTEGITKASVDYKKTETNRNLKLKRELKGSIDKTIDKNRKDFRLNK